MFSDRFGTGCVEREFIAHLEAFLFAGDAMLRYCKKSGLAVYCFNKVVLPKPAGARIAISFLSSAAANGSSKRGRSSMNWVLRGLVLEVFAFDECAAIASIAPLLLVILLA